MEERTWREYRVIADAGCGEKNGGFLCIGKATVVEEVVEEVHSFFFVLNDLLEAENTLQESENVFCPKLSAPAQVKMNTCTMSYQ